jgi:hypothetical protein
MKAIKILNQAKIGYLNLYYTKGDIDEAIKEIQELQNSIRLINGRGVNTMEGQIDIPEYLDIEAIEGFMPIDKQRWCDVCLSSFAKAHRLNREEIYYCIVQLYTQYNEDFDDEETIRREANIYAVKNTDRIYLFAQSNKDTKWIQ